MLFWVCLAATAVVAPIIFLGNYSGHDFVFHVESWMDAAGQWREGIALPRWAEWANWGFGEPRFVFYPPLSWLAGAAIGSVLPWRMAPGTFIWLVLIVAGMSMWRLARDYFSAPYAAVAAVLYAVNPFELVNVYYRSAFGEMLAAALLPLLIWAALRIVSGEWRRVPALALIFAAIWLSNAPAAVIATYSLSVVVAAGCLLRRSLRPLATMACSMIAGFGLAAFYIVPATWEQKWIQVGQVVADTFRPSVNFLFSRANDPDFVAFNWKVSWVATGLIAATAIALVATSKKRKEAPGTWWALAALAAVAVFMMLPPSLWLWRALPKLWFAQFPWRWLDALGLAFAFFVASMIESLRTRMARWTLAAAVFAAICAAAVAMVRDAPRDTSDVARVADAIRSGRGYEGTDEYAPVGCDRYQLPGNPDDSERPEGVSPNPAPRIAKLDPGSDEIVPAAGVRLHTVAWTSERRAFDVDSTEPVTLALRLVNYPAWAVYVNGREVPSSTRPPMQQILVPIERGSNQVEVRFRRTRDRAWGGAISMLTATALCAFSWGYRRRRIIGT